MLGGVGAQLERRDATPPVIVQFSAITSLTTVASLPQVSTPPPRLNVQLRTRMCSTGGLSLSFNASTPFEPFSAMQSSVTEK